MKKIVNSGRLLFIIALHQLIFINKANAFTVELFKSDGVIDSLDDADAVISGTNLESTSLGVYDIVDFRDVAYGTPWGHSDIDNFFPGTTGNPNINNYAVLATAKIEISTADDWTFLTSGDDGLRLRIDESDVIYDNSVHPTRDNLGTVNLSAGEHDVELVMFDHTGVGSLELWAARGRYSAYNNSDFRLVGDVANGGIAAVPWEFSPSMGLVLSLGLFGLNQYYKKYRNKYYKK